MKNSLLLTGSSLLVAASALAHPNGVAGAARSAYREAP
jgi:hypothetical protein